ncbi:hypothetical protein [Ruminococcus sp. NK3A76]|uniref:hypothetical protein n=1 Tax=Ruminococcus sp. NK3A76 TaxID=877411 RepID=UPI000491B3FF|nr:hypothetical protein [Ruminococcus sp. NK3A76]
MENEKFQLINGVDVELDDSVISAYTENDSGFEAVVSAEKIPQLVGSFIGLLDEPVFFFLELPKNADEEDTGYDIYYLDNCTIPVAKAIMKRYGELLVQDGISRFGFGSHSSNDEIYVMDYQQISIYCPEKRKTAALLSDLSIKKVNKLRTMWEGFSEETPGISLRVDVNGENVFDIVENLKSEGMYKAEDK